MPVWTGPQNTITSTGTTNVTTPEYLTSAIIECWGGGGKGSTLTSNGGGVEVPVEAIVNQLSPI